MTTYQLAGALRSKSYRYNYLQSCLTTRVQTTMELIQLKIITKKPSLLANTIYISVANCIKQICYQVKLLPFSVLISIATALCCLLVRKSRPGNI